MAARAESGLWVFYSVKFRGISVKRLLLTAAACAAIATCAHAGTPTVDGTLDASYGAPTAVVGYDPTALDSNFGEPGNASKYIGYSIYLQTDSKNLYGFLQASGPGASVAPFANLYFDIDPKNPDDQGSDIGFELSPGAQNFFIPDNGTKTAVSGIDVVSADGGLAIEFSIPMTFFTTVVPGVTYDAGTIVPTIGGPVVMRLSQSFGYSVAGGSSYGDTRLGEFTVKGAVPEPASWSLMILGFLGAGAGLRASRRRSAAAA